MCCLLKILKDTRNGPHQHKALKRRNQGQPPATKTGRGLARKAGPQAAKYEDARHPSAHKYHIMDVGARGSKTILKFRRGLMATIENLGRSDDVPWLITPPGDWVPNLKHRRGPPPCITVPASMYKLSDISSNNRAIIEQ